MNAPLIPPAFLRKLIRPAIGLTLIGPFTLQLYSWNSENGDGASSDVELDFATSADAPAIRAMDSRDTISAAGEDGAEPLDMQRGRPTLNASGTTFVGDNGQPLRGHFASTEWSEPPPRSAFESLKDFGSNAVHLYAEVFDPEYPEQGSQAPGYSAQRIDEVVEITRELGLYLVMTIGNGAENGSFNRDYVMDFWEFYAPRYKDETHVIYEIQNEPVAWTPPYPQGALDMELDAYNLIRSHAPETPVLLFSYAVLSSGEAVLQDLDKIGDSIDWSNAGIAIHGYAGYEDTVESLEVVLDAGYPCFMTEFTTSEWGYSKDHLDAELTAALERFEVSWLSFLHIPPNFINQAFSEPNAFYDVVENTGLSWTPDYGNWPVARGVFGNDGIPPATADDWSGGRLTGILRVQAENFDEGGQGVAYDDADPENVGGQFRTDEGVDIGSAGDGYAVERAEGGEWLEYTIFVNEAGYYDFNARYAAAESSSAIAIVSNGKQVGELALPSSGGAASWATENVVVFLEYGRQKMRLAIESGGFSLDWFELSPTAQGPIADGTYRLVNRSSGLAMEGDTVASAVKQSPYAGQEHEWILEHLGAGQYQVRFAATTRYWNVNLQENEEPLDLFGWWDIDEPRHRFLISPTSDGFYYLRVADGGLSLEVAGGSLESDALVQQYRYNGEPHQQWAIQTASDVAFPSGLTVDVVEGGYELAWTAAPGVDSYNVKRSSQEGGPYATIATEVTEVKYLDTDIVTGDIWYYVVSATVGSEESLDSAEAVSKPPRLQARFGFDEASGSIAHDDSDGGWEGTLHGGASWSEGRDAGAVALDGVDGHVQLSEGLVSDLTDFTIATWVNLDARPTWARIFDFGTGTNNYMFLTASGPSGTARFAITTGSGEQIVEGDQTLPTGEWTHVAITLQGSSGVLYVNGAEVGRNDDMTLAPEDLGVTNQNYIGRSQWAADTYLDGRIDDFRIYSNAFDAAGVRAIFEEQPRPPIAEAELQAPQVEVAETAIKVMIEETVPGRSYRLEGSVDLEAWIPISATELGDGEVLQFMVPLDEIEPTLFIRVGIRK